MKQLIGISHNIKKVIIGKITYKKEIFNNKKDLIYVTKTNHLPNGYTSIITSLKDVEKTSKVLVCEVESIDKLFEGDIVTIEPNGTINIVFDINSHHNAIFITEKCNSNCIMCPQPPVKHEDDKFNLNLKYISLIVKNTESLGITGGEPTLIGDKLFDILRAIHKRIPKVTINLLTNGIKFENYEYAKRFALSIRQNIIVDIPLYSDIDTIHNNIVRTKTFYKTIKGIYNLAKFNIKIGIRIVVHKINYKRLPEIAEYIYSNFPFAYHITFMQMEPVGYAKDNIDSLWIDPVDYNKELEKAVLNLYYRDMQVSIYNTQLCILPESIRQFAVQSISDWKNIYIDECEECIMKEQCPGFFASSKVIHSRKIKPFKKEIKRLKLKTEINENNYLQHISKKFIEFIPYLENVKKYDIMDIPCGYGRNMYLLAKKGFKLVGVDSDNAAISYIESMKLKYDYNKKNIKLINSDILNELVFLDSSLGGIINIHLYKLELITKFKKALIKGGYLYIETPNLQGENDIELPEKNVLKNRLENEFDLIYYKEKSNETNNKVSVILFARKK